MAVERTNANGITSQHGERVTTGNHSNRRAEWEQRYTARVVLSVLQRRALQGQMNRAIEIWNTSRRMFRQDIEVFRNSDPFNYLHLSETWEQVNKEYKQERAQRIAYCRQIQMNAQTEENDSQNAALRELVAV